MQYKFKWKIGRAENLENTQLFEWKTDSTPFARKEIINYYYY